MLDILQQDSCRVNNRFLVSMPIMETTGERIARARKRVGLNQAQLAEACGWGQSRIGNYEAGISEPKRADFEKMADVLGVSPASLQFGTDLNTAQPNYNIDRYALIPRYEVLVGAGTARDNGHEEISGTHAYRRDWLERKGLLPGSCAVIEVDGDSMEPTINDGDVVLVNMAAKRIVNGTIFAFRTDEGPRLKRLIKQLDGRVKVVSDNPDKIKHRDEYLTPGMEADIIGQVVHRSGGV